jgi:hypothetical protein
MKTVNALSRVRLPERPFDISIRPVILRFDEGGVADDPASDAAFIRFGETLPHEGTEKNMRQRVAACAKIHRIGALGISMSLGL